MDPARAFKYGVDRIAAAILLIAFSPLLGAIALAIRLDSPGSPFFLQERIGVAGRPFTIFKFRTMRTGREADGLGVSTAADDDRITRVGRFLRATSLDEVPQLLNILLGEMSFIGPRPTLRYQVEAYSLRQQRRLLFRPGITGWAQIHGRNSIPWDRRIELDLAYVDGFSLGRDVSILWRTLGVVGRRNGVYAAGGANDAFVATAVPAPDDVEAVNPSETARTTDLTAESVAKSSPEVSPALLLPEPVGLATAPDAADVVPAHSEPEVENDPVLYPAPASAIRLPLLIIGAGGHARVLIDIAEKQGRFRVFGLLDESARETGATVMGYPILGGREQLNRRALPSHAIVAIGSPVHRAAWQEALEELGFQLAILVHPAAQVARDVEIGAGTVLMAQVAVNPGTRLGRGVIINTGASVDHDCDIGDFAHVAPGARLAGGVRIGARAHIGIGSCIIQRIEIGHDAVVGAGAAVVRPVPSGITVGGVPARPLAVAANPGAPIAAAAAAPARV